MAEGIDEKNMGAVGLFKSPRRRGGGGGGGHNSSKNIHFHFVAHIRNWFSCDEMLLPLTFVPYSNVLFVYHTALSVLIVLNFRTVAVAEPFLSSYDVLMVQDVTVHSVETPSVFNLN